MKTLKRGSRGQEVKTLQEALKIMADGVFGKLTEEAVREWQRSHSLKVDGIVGPQTWATLSPGVLAKSRRQIDEIILHCTATPEGRPVTVEQIREMHTAPEARGGRGWSDIGYHYVIYLDGSIHVGRSVDVAGAHCSGHNTRSIGVVYVGGLDRGNNYKDTRTPEQRAALERLVTQLLETCGLGKDAVHGHNEYAAKACPCFDVKKEWRM